MKLQRIALGLAITFGLAGAVLFYLKNNQLQPGKYDGTILTHLEEGKLLPPIVLVRLFDAGQSKPSLQRDGRWVVGLPSWSEQSKRFNVRAYATFKERDDQIKDVKQITGQISDSAPNIGLPKSMPGDVVTVRVGQ